RETKEAEKKETENREAEKTETEKADSEKKATDNKDTHRELDSPLSFAPESQFNNLEAHGARLLGHLSLTKTQQIDPQNDLDFRPTDKSQTNKSDLDPETEIPSIQILGVSLKPEDDIQIAQKEIVETSCLQIRDQSGQIIAASGDAIMNINIERDATTGAITSIGYPDGKIRNFIYIDGSLSGIETIEMSRNGKLSRTNLTKENGMWFSEKNGTKVGLFADIRFDNDGALSFQQRNGRDWRCELPDGSILMERINKTGARISTNEDNEIRSLVRADNSHVKCKCENGELLEIAEIDKNANKVTWTKTDDKWISDTTPPRERLHFQIHKNGNLSYTD
ncbi:MAG: hypothetical protein K8F91_25570, partial [Candidatus Obscuribacterales bacterium]|nr:hypothetical protein [Candidatus Obscuribacterales bacterium]